MIELQQQHGVDVPHALAAGRVRIDDGELERVRVAILQLPCKGADV